MRPPRTLRWRVAGAYAALLLLSAAAAALVLALDETSRSSAPRIAVVAAVAAALALLLSAPMAHIVTRGDTRSLRGVSRALRRLARGEMEQRVPVEPGSELGELAQAFNDMSVSLTAMVSEYREDHDKLSAILATMNDGVVLIDGEGNTTLINPAAQEALRLPASQRGGEGQRFIELVRDHELNSLVALCQETGELQYLEVEFLDSRRYLSVIATPLRLDVQEGVLLVLHDLTEARRVETTRREFVANVSHELRTPLAAVRGAVETLQEGALSDAEAAPQFLARIQRDVDRMTRMVEELLNLSRLESGEVNLNLESIDISRSISEAVELYRDEASSLGVELEAADCGDLPRAVADEARLQQVLSNLVENAVRFTPAGGRVRIEATSRNGSLEVSVKDTGIGMGPEHLPHVFERFYKGDRATPKGGTGLGLAIAKHIVQAHGGWIKAESRIGEDSAFTFSIPADKTETTI